MSTDTIVTNTDITFHIVDAVDNEMEPCPLCDDVDATIVAQVYYTSVDPVDPDMRSFVGGCIPCVMRTVVLNAQSDLPVVVEFSVDAIH